MTDKTPLIFLDANVLFTAAHNPNGKASLLFELGDQGYWRIITSSLAVEEAQRNLAIKFPAFMYRLKALVGSITVAPSVFGAACPISLPEKDRAIFLTALKCRATHLLTGDIRHFGPFTNDPPRTAGLAIMTIADFLKNRDRNLFSPQHKNKK